MEDTKKLMTALIVVTLLVTSAVRAQTNVNKSFTNGIGNGLWSEPDNWDPNGVPQFPGGITNPSDPDFVGGAVNIDSNLTATIDYAAPDIDVLYITRFNGAGSNGFGDGTLNMIGNASLTVRQENGGGLDWSYIGQGPNKATLNMSGDSSIIFGVPGSLHNVLFNWGNSGCADSDEGEAEINLDDNATMTVENSIWLWQGKSRTNIRGNASITAGGLVFNTGCVNADNVINLDGGELRLVGDQVAAVDGWAGEGKIVAINGTGVVVATYDGGADLTTAVAVPVLASQPNPADGAVEVPLNVQLSWADAGLPANPTYDVLFGTDPNNLVLESAEQVGTTHTPQGIPLDNCTTYYWRIDVAGTDPNGIPADKKTGIVWSFETEPTIPRAALVKPLNGQTGVENDAVGMELEWTGDPGADSFDVWFGPCDGEMVLVSQEQVGLTYNPFTDPAVATDWGTEYCWRVDSVKNGQPDCSGIVWTFTTYELVCDPVPAGDVTGPNGVPDCIFDFWDLRAMGMNWLSCGWDRVVACP